MLLLVLLAINAWDPVTGRMRRFSLRFILVAITIISFVLGLLVYMVPK